MGIAVGGQPRIIETRPAGYLSDGPPEVLGGRGQPRALAGSYADFITLFSPFRGHVRIVVDQRRQVSGPKLLTNAFRNVTGQGGSTAGYGDPGALVFPPKPVVKPGSIGGAKKVQREKMKMSPRTSWKRSQPLVAEGKVRLLKPAGVTIEINDKVLLPPAKRLQSVSISAPGGYRRSALTDFPHYHRGVTMDNVPISTAQFPSNWELSALRATTVLRFIQRLRESGPNA